MSARCSHAEAEDQFFAREGTEITEKLCDLRALSAYDVKMNDPRELEKSRKIRRWLKVSSLLAAGSGLAVAGIAYSHYRRPRDVRWLDHAHLLHHATTSNFRRINGVRMHYQESAGEPGDETLVLLHGFCSSNYTWKDCILPLSEAGYRVVSIDLKGYGFSEKPRDHRYDVNDQAELVLGLMDSLGIQSATLVGNSYGGAVSMACALKQPQRVDRLVLISSAHNNRALQRMRRYQWLLNSFALAEVLSPVLFGSSRFVRHYLGNMYHDKSVLSAERFSAYHRPLLSASCQAAALTTLRQWQLDWIEAELGAIKQPTLIIWGEYDWALPVEWGAEIHMAIPHSQFIVIPDCGHLPQEERPQEICDFILDFIAQDAGDVHLNVRQLKG